MTLYRLGGHWAHEHRTYYEGIAAPFTVELLYLDDDDGDFSRAGARDRVQKARDRGVLSALRVDYARGQSLPPEGDHAAVSWYVNKCKDIATDPVLKHVTWLIPGNEPNLRAENQWTGQPMTARWVARVIYGHGRPDWETDNVYQFVRTFNDQMMVLLPAIGPYSPEASGTRQMPPFIDGRRAWSPWERYDFDLWVSAYQAHAPVGEVRGAVHTYGMPGIATVGPGEPFTDQREGTFGAQFGTRWLQDHIWLATQAQKRAVGTSWAPWSLITECNVYRPPQTPKDDYPAGWWKQVAAYVNTQPNIYGLAAFVDQNLGNVWTDTCMTAGVGRLPQWDADHDALLREGWA